MSNSPWRGLSDRLAAALHPAAPPIAITFAASPPAGVPLFSEPMAEPAGSGRTGRVPAGCVFWTKAAGTTFTTVAEDHANCSVGMVTHGLATWDDVGDRDDVATLLETGWVTPDMVPAIPTVTSGQGAVTYGPLAETPVEPDVVLLRLTAKSLMVLADALPGLRIEGKPQCHIVAVAKEQGEPVASVGCMLSRVRTAMPSGEVTCAIPAGRLESVVESLERTAGADAKVSAYAADDARRFS